MTGDPPTHPHTLMERRIKIMRPWNLTDAQVEAQIERASALFEELLDLAARNAVQQIDLPGLTYRVVR
jgi:hypothetical protein